MQWYYIVLICVSLVVLLSLVPFHIGLQMYWNIGANLGVVAVRLWGITLSCFQLEITESAINIIRRKGKESRVTFDTLNQDAIFTHFFLVSVFRYIIIREISLFVEVGKKNDASTSALVSGVALQLMHCFYAIMYSTKGIFRAVFDAESKVDQNKIALAGVLKIFIAPIILLLSIIRALKRVKRLVKMYERNSGK